MQLSQICLQKFGISSESCLLLLTKKVAEHCCSFILSCSSSLPPPVRLIEYIICPKDKPNTTLKTSHCGELHMVLFPEDSFPLAKQFWQHTGLGLSSWFAEYCLSLLPDEPSSPTMPLSPSFLRPSKGGNRHYSNKSLSNGSATLNLVIPTQIPPAFTETLTKAITSTSKNAMARTSPSALHLLPNKWCVDRSLVFSLKTQLLSIFQHRTWIRNWR